VLETKKELKMLLKRAVTIVVAAGYIVFHRRKRAIAMQMTAKEA